MRSQEVVRTLKGDSGGVDQGVGRSWSWTATGRGAPGDTDDRVRVATGLRVPAVIGLGGAGVGTTHGTSEKP